VESVARVLVSEDEYLSTSFPGVDHEYIHGELRPKPMPDRFHATIQARLATFLNALRAQSVEAGTEPRCRIRPGLILIPDVAAFRTDLPFENVPTTPPLAVAEVVSKDDRYSDLLHKLTEYREWGVLNIWVIDPWRRQLSACVTQGLVDVPSLRLPEYGFEVTLDQLIEGLPLPPKP
jgi:Uma2 family endonuclease